jgi:hypothetical protein
MTLFVPGVAAAWLVTLVVATAGATAAAIARNPSSAGEVPFLFVLVMSVPFALTAAFVLLPLMSLTAAMTRSRQWALFAAGISAAPLQALALLATGRVLFRGPNMRPTLADDITAVLWHAPPETLAMLLAFAAGGVTYALWHRRLAARSI